MPIELTILSIGETMSRYAYFCSATDKHLTQVPIPTFESLGEFAARSLSTGCQFVDDAFSSFSVFQRSTTADAKQFPTTSTLFDHIDSASTPQDHHDRSGRKMK